MRYYKFVSWDVPPVENCFSSRIPAALLEELKSGATVRIYARKPDEAAREILETEGL